MAADIPFEKTFDLVPGVAEEVMPGLRRILCNNPSPFTYKGTVSYIIGQGQVAIVDPGPDDPAHIAALLDAVRGETVTHIFVTHTHRDHSPATGAIKAATGALVLAEGPHRPSRPLSDTEAVRMDSSNDTDFVPDRQLVDGEVVTGSAWAVEAITTPGHTANHMAFALRDRGAILCGDHVMAWSTPVVAPPDGSMGDYMASLAKLSKREETVYWPGHGGVVRNAPRFVAAYTLHRKAREASIVNQITKGATDIPSIVSAIYANLDPRLVRAAGMSVFAHLEDLVARGVVATDGAPSVAGRYRSAA